MAELDVKGWFSFIYEPWDRGSLFLWALATAAGATALALGLATHFNLIALAPIWPVGFAIGAVVLGIIGVFRLVDERRAPTLVLVPNSAQSFFHHALQQDGRRLTQIAVSGWATNCTEDALYPTLAKIAAPFGTKTEQELIATQDIHGKMFGLSNPVGPGERREVTAHFFAHGFVGRAGRAMRVVVKVCDNRGRWHSWVFPKLKNS